VRRVGKDREVYFYECSVFEDGLEQERRLVRVAPQCLVREQYWNFGGQPVQGPLGSSLLDAFTLAG
jgi:hypothetical protein